MGILSFLPIIGKFVDKGLDGLDLDPDVRSRLETEIRETVPRPRDDWPLWCVRCIPQYDE